GGRGTPHLLALARRSRPDPGGRAEAPEPPAPTLRARVEEHAEAVQGALRRSGRSGSCSQDASAACSLPSSRSRIFARQREMRLAIVPAGMSRAEPIVW